MEQIVQYVTSLDWANNWLIYIATSILVAWLGVLTLKFIFTKIIYIIKRTFILAAIVSVVSLISYMLFLLGVIDIDILSLIGLSGISMDIQLFFQNLHEWFRFTFSLAGIFTNILK